jgi:hypothetical protein
MLNVNLNNMQLIFPSRSEFYSPGEDSPIYNMTNISLTDVPAMLLSDQVDFGVSRYAMLSSRQGYLDYVSAAFSIK